MVRKEAEFDPFADIENAVRSVRGAYIDKPGKHVFEIKEAKFLISNNPASRGKAYFVAELDVVESEAYVVGESRTWMQDMSKPSPEAALGAVREFLAAALGKTIKDMTRDVCTEAVDETQPLRGTTVVCDARNITTKRGTDFTLCIWRECKD